MNSEVHKAKQRFQTAAASALLSTNQNLLAFINHPFHVATCSSRAYEAYRDQWVDAAGAVSSRFDWAEIWRRHRDLDALHLALWSSADRLSALALFLASNRSVEIRFLEGDSRADCPLKGLRALIVVEAAASYAQAIGKAEVRVTPINEKTRALYEVGLGFEAVSERGRERYFRRNV